MPKKILEDKPSVKKVPPQSRSIKQTPLKTPSAEEKAASSQEMDTLATPTKETSAEASILKSAPVSLSVESPVKATKTAQPEETNNEGDEEATKTVLPEESKDREATKTALAEETKVKGATKTASTEEITNEEPITKHNRAVKTSTAGVQASEAMNLIATAAEMQADDNSDVDYYAFTVDEIQSTNKDVKAYLKGLDNIVSSNSLLQYAELPLTSLPSFTEGLPIHSLLHERKTPLMGYRLALGLVYPSDKPRIAAKERAKKGGKDFTRARDMAFHFLMDHFGQEEDSIDKIPIEQAVTRYPTFILLMYKPTNTKNKQYNLISYATTQVIGVLNFMLHQSEGGKFDAYVNWLCVLDERSVHKMPDSLLRWRQLGLGTLLFVVLIKAMAYLYDEKQSKDETTEEKRNLSVHLQCSKSDKKAFAFYKKLGFQDMEGENNAFDQLPSVIKRFLKTKDPNHHFFIPGSQGSCYLMSLKHEGLVITDHEADKSNEDIEVITIGSTPKMKDPPGSRIKSINSSIVWCAFPREAIGHDFYKASEFDDIVNQLPLLAKMAPGVLEQDKSANLYYTRFINKYSAAVRCHRRVNDMQWNFWLNTSELELLCLVSIRAQPQINQVLLIPADIMADIRYCCECKETQKTESKNYKSGCAKIQKFVFRNCDLLYKEMLIFNNHVDGCHWTGTFVFNPVLCTRQDTLRDTDAICGFLCSDTLGDQSAKSNKLQGHHGVIWFLNYAASVVDFVSANPKKARAILRPGKDLDVDFTSMKRVYPFGKLESADEEHTGQCNFVKLHFAEPVMARQTCGDTYNCAIGQFTAIHVCCERILDEKFQMKDLQDVGDWNCQLPCKNNKSKLDVTTVGFLDKVRLEFMVLIDSMAQKTKSDVPEYNKTLGQIREMPNNCLFTSSEIVEGVASHTSDSPCVDVWKVFETGAPAYLPSSAEEKSQKQECR